MKIAGCEQITQYVEKLCLTDIIDWQRTDRVLRFYPNITDDNVYFEYKSDYDSEHSQTLVLYVKRKKTVSISKDGKGSYLVQNEVDDSVDGILDKLKYRRLFAHIDGFYRHLFEKDILICRQNHQEIEKKVEQEKIEIENQFIKCLVDSSFDSASTEWEEEGFHIKFHRNLLGCYTTLYWYNAPILQGVLGEDSFDYAILTNSQAFIEIANTYKKEWKETVGRLLQEYHDKVPKVLEVLSRDCLFLEAQREWLNTEERSFISYLTTVTDNMKKSTDAINYEKGYLAVFLRDKKLEVEEMKKKIEHRKIRSIQVQTKRIRLRFLD